MPRTLLAFGAPAVVHDGEATALPFERRTQLLAFLALRRTWIGRSELAALLWPDLDRRLAFANLRKTLFRLPAAPWGGAVESGDGAVRAVLDTDVRSFEEALRDGRPGDALARYRGDLLAGFDDEGNEAWTQWLRFERDRLRTAWRLAALGHLDGDIASAEALALCAQLVEADPLDEAAVGAQIGWLARAGHVARAHEAYRTYAARLREELGLEPGTALATLHAALAGGERSGERRIPAAAPAAADGFVGRVAELRTLEERLALPECRLLCVLGPGGVGKTRLARRAMQLLAPRFADGATFVPLEDLSDPSEIGSRLARELGVRPGARGDALAQALEALAEREMLVVLDNAEHLVHGATTFEQLLAAAPGVKALVTSRVRLATPSEWTLPLAGLPCPGTEDADRLEAFDAARLFVNAARRAGVDVAAASDADAIVDICRRVDGLPLALELAAAWTRVLPCAAIADELRLGAELLRTPDGSQPSRHASIEHVFEQSWRLLAPAERDALARLSVFRGGFAPGAALAAAHAGLPVLGALVDKSLLRKDGPRLDMHPLVQRLAALRLEGAARDEAEAAHAQHFHRLLAQSRRAVDDGDREALQAIETEFENVRVAWRWAVARGAGGALAASAPTLMHFCDHRGRFAEGAALLREAVDAPVAAAAALRSRLLGAVAHLEYRQDRYDDAMRTATRALADARASPDADAQLQGLIVLGGASLRLARYEEARRYFGRALRQAAAGSDPHVSAAMLDNLALIAKYQGDYDESLRLSLRSLDEHRRLGDAAGEALCLNNAGALCLDIGRHDDGAGYLAEGLRIAVAHGFVTTRALLVANMTELAIKRGDLDGAERHARLALDLASTTGLRAAAAVARMRLAQVATRRGELATARSELGEGLALARAINREQLMVAGASCFADLLAAQGEHDCARQVLGFVVDHPATAAADREEMRARLAAWPGTTARAPGWPGLALADLVDRIVAEASAAHAPLLRFLRAGSAAQAPSVR